MPKNKYILSINNRTALARNKRLREAGASVYVTGSTTIAGTTVSSSGLTTVATTGSGNAVTDGRVSSDGKAVVLRKGATFLTESGADDMFLRKDQDDSTDYVLGMGAAQVNTSLSVGGSTTLGGTLEVVAGSTLHDDLTVEGLTRRVDAYITGSSGTPQFADGFDGYGWRLWNRGTDGDDHHLTVDSLTVRRTMSVYELLIQKIRAIGGQFIISPANGTIATVDTYTEEGVDYYALTLEDVNAFQAHDLMRCQAFTGNDIKSYWVEIESVAGDYIFIPVAEFDKDGCYPAVGDEVVLCGNTANGERQSVIVLSATEGEAPRVDLHDGVNSKAFSYAASGTTLGTLRTRQGKLDDITDDWFPADRQPLGYGLYADNAFLRGNFVLANTGEDVGTLFQVVQGNISALLTADEQANYLSNSTFAADTDKWVVSGGTIVYDSVAGRNVLALQNMATQSNSDYNLHPTFDDDGEGLSIPRDFTLSFYGRTPDGAALNIYFEGEDTSGFEDYTPLGYDTRGALLTYALTADEQYYEIAFRWDGTGDLCFKQIMTGLSGGCTAYLRDVRLVADNITYFTTLFSQTVGSITALAARIDNLPDEIYKTIAGLYVSVDTYSEDMLDVNDNIQGLRDTFGKYVEIDAFTGLFAQQVNGTTGEGHAALIAAFVGKYEEEYTYIDPDTGEEKTETVPTVESGILLTADRILLEGYVSINKGFAIDEYGNMHANNGTFDGTITANAGKIGMWELNSDKVLESKTYYGQMYLDSSIIRFLSAGDEVAGHDSQIYMGVNTAPAEQLYYSPLRIIVSRDEAPSSGGDYENVGIYISTYGRTYDNFKADSEIDRGNHALYIEKGDIMGFRLRTRRIDSDTTLSVMDSVILIAGGCTLTLPADPEDGQMYFLRGIGSTATVQTGNVNRFIRWATSSYGLSITARDAVITVLLYDSRNDCWWANLMGNYEL